MSATFHPCGNCLAFGAAHRMVPNPKNPSEKIMKCPEADTTYCRGDITQINKDLDTISRDLERGASYYFKNIWGEWAFTNACDPVLRCLKQHGKVKRKLDYGRDAEPEFVTLEQIRNLSFKEDV